MKLPRSESVPVSPQYMHTLLAAAERAADQAANVTRRYFRQRMDIRNKASGGAFDPVTNADREAEQEIRKSLQADCPDIGFFGEEFDPDLGGNGLLWVVDPIDGTRAFMSGMPLWGTLIGLYDGQDAILGLLDQPILNERYLGHDDKARLQAGSESRVLQTRQGHSLAMSVFYCTTPDMFSGEYPRRGFERIRDSVQLTRYGGDCYAYALLASGFVDIVLDCDLQPYDIAALIPIVRAAGGVVTDWQGNSAVDGGMVIAAATEQLHAEALALINQ